MKFAVKDDFLEITQLFQKYAKLFPHVRMGYINSRIEQVIFGCYDGSEFSLNYVEYFAGMIKED